MFSFQKKQKPEIRIFNTAGSMKEKFEPLRTGKVSLYSCGPTVYDFPHIGNARSFLFSDIVRRVFEYAGYDVKQVMNITDFGHLVGDADDTEDKMLLALKREGLPLTMENMFMVASRYIDAFREDLSALNIKTPHVMPRASEHVPGMIAYVEVLLHKGYAYTTSDGVYFDTEKWPAYGILGGSASKDHSRVGVSGEKKNQKDFALWKFSESSGWDAPWGKGFPGWHIECVAMSTRYLGKSFDIHTGGIDHIAVHHNNEIAQAEAANSKHYARFWLHNEFITIDARRIGKSEGNSITLSQLKDRDVPALAYRYWLLTGHYRSPMNFTWEAVLGAKTARDRALRAFNELQGRGFTHEEYMQRFSHALYDDFNTPEAVAVMWELIKDDSIPSGDKKATLIQFDRVLGIGFERSGREEGARIAVLPDESIPEGAQALLLEREEARATGDFARADSLRAKIQQEGFVIEDTPEGPRLKRVASRGVIE